MLTNLDIHKDPGSGLLLDQNDLGQDASNQFTGQLHLLNFKEAIFADVRSVTHVTNFSPGRRNRRGSAKEQKKKFTLGYLSHIIGTSTTNY
jgi:hypothetical protein